MHRYTPAAAPKVAAVVTGEIGPAAERVRGRGRGRERERVWERGLSGGVRRVLGSRE